MPAYHDTMPVDISFVFADEKTADKQKATYDEKGYLNFRIGDENNPACYYLIVKE